MGDGYQEVQEVISIHAPTRGATSLKATEYKLSIDFNPRSHERSDNYIPDEFKSYIISIHAPTRGATNPLSVLCSLAIIFQSTLPREERHFPYSCQYSIYNFNPRSHERSDQGTKLFKTLLYNFNPRSHERSDGHTSISSSCGNYFNPRSHERSDQRAA